MRDARRPGRGVAAVGRLLAVIARHRARAAGLADEPAVGAGSVAESAAALGAGRAALAVPFARIERPEAAHVERRLVLAGQEERRVARIFAGGRRQIDRGDNYVYSAIRFTF